jgi:hypothetical protein
MWAEKFGWKFCSGINRLVVAVEKVVYMVGIVMELGK